MILLAVVCVCLYFNDVAKSDENLRYNTLLQVEKSPDGKHVAYKRGRRDNRQNLSAYHIA